MRPEHDLNVGSAVRVMKNFGCKELYLVKPQCKLGFEAVLFAKHSKEVLENAKKVPSLSKALQGCDYAIATTGVPVRYRKSLKNLVPIEEAISKIDASEKIALVFGSESTGLSKKELEQCDVVATVPTSIEHPVLNLSHAVAVCTYEAFKQGKVQAISSMPRKRLASREKRADLQSLFSAIAHSVHKIRDPKKVSNSFKNVLERARPTEQEAQTLYAALGPLAGMARKKKVSALRRA